ncbi:hypothetical protein J1605_007992 [Eschrichtius robustus]|uniref:Uncharacterized protein n=1 Tax=Eschrichtius robustus TaxID=9764 RepID=A0AB34H0U9_ESCRO|nr:hypothetical protein J1605_007992 [Eschrichtius robustus]
MRLPSYPRSTLAVLRGAGAMWVRGDRAPRPPAQTQEAPSSEELDRLVPQPSKEGSDGPLLRVREGRKLRRNLPEVSVLDQGFCNCSLPWTHLQILLKRWLRFGRSGEEPNNASGRQDGAETTGARCAFCHRVLEWKQKMEKKGHRGINRGRFPVAMQNKARHPDSLLGSDTGLSCYSASGTGLQSNKCENCSTKIHNSQRVCGKASSKEFHYIFNTPGQNFFNHSKRSAFAQLRYLNENKNSSPCKYLSCKIPSLYTT